MAARRYGPAEDARRDIRRQGGGRARGIGAMQGHSSTGQGVREGCAADCA